MHFHDLQCTQIGVYKNANVTERNTPKVTNELLREKTINGTTIRLHKETDINGTTYPVTMQKTGEVLPDGVDLGFTKREGVRLFNAFCKLLKNN